MVTVYVFMIDYMRFTAKNIKSAYTVAQMFV